MEEMHAWSEKTMGRCMRNDVKRSLARAAWWGWGEIGACFLEALEDKEGGVLVTAGNTPNYIPLTDSTSQ